MTLCCLFVRLSHLPPALLFLLVLLAVFAGCSYVHTAGVPCVNVSAIAYCF